MVQREGAEFRYEAVLPQINFIRGSASTTSVTYTAVLPVRDETEDFLAGLLAAERVRRGTRSRSVYSSSSTKRTTASARSESAATPC